jgi:argininosuccinate lyase
MAATDLTGRIAAGPSRLTHEEILEPQFRFEVVHLLPFYVLTEKVLLIEYLRMALVTPVQATKIGKLLDRADRHTLAADPAANMSDLAFALELAVTGRLTEPVPGWHIDRSRNDLQACVQLMYGRDQLLEMTGELLSCFWSVRDLAGRHVSTLMPGYTHLQPAQVMTPGFYLAGLAHHLLHTARRMLAVYDDAGLCPLGAAAMTGQELAFDRDRMAVLLGFAAAHPHPLTAVASRAWVLETAAECATFGVGLSRFVTDLMTWGSGQYHFFELPDELSGISSAMPQKKNYPVLERIRGRTAHLASCYIDCATAQRAAAFSNSVEVSKEGTARLPDALAAMRSVLRLTSSVLDHLTFREQDMRSACDNEYLGGLSLANDLALNEMIPWRTAQVIAGAYILAAQRRGRPPAQPDPGLLAELADSHGYRLTDPAGLLDRALAPEGGLLRKQTSGSAHPVAVQRLLAEQESEARELDRARQERGDRLRAGRAEADRVLGLTAETAGR